MSLVDFKQLHWFVSVWSIRSTRQHTMNPTLYAHKSPLVTIDVSAAAFRDGPTRRRSGSIRGS